MRAEPRRPAYAPYRSASRDFALGLKPIRAHQWILVGPDHGAIMREKRARLAHAPDHFFRAQPGSKPAQRELASRVARHLLTDHAAHFSRDGDALVSHADGTRVVLDAGPDPLWQLSQLIEEDFMLLQPVDGMLTITAASNAYSSSGRLVSSVGRGMPWTHQGVPDLTERLGTRIDRVLDSVHEATPCERFNWQVTPLGTLFFPHEHTHAANAEAARRVQGELARDPQRAGDLLYIRVERQTLSRLPETRAVAFSLHTFSDPLSVLAGDPPAARAMRDLLKSYTDERLAYAEMDILRAPLLAYLESLSP